MVELAAATIRTHMRDNGWMPYGVSQTEMKKLVRDAAHKALEAALHDKVTEKDDAEIERLTAIVDRYRSALEIIAGQPQSVLEAMQAKAALANIGPDIPK